MSSLRDTGLDGMKGMMILLVNWGHAIQYLGYEAAGAEVAKNLWHDPVFKGIYLFHMPLFMVLSGFLCERALGRDASLARLGRNFLRLGVPVLFWYLVFKFGRYLVLNGGAGFAGYALGGVWEYALLEVAFMGWFVWLVLGFGALLLLLRRLNCDRSWVLATLWLGSLFLKDRGVLFLAQFCLPYFCAGYLWAKGREGLIPLWRPWMGWACLPLAVGACAVYHWWTPICFVYNQSWSFHSCSVGELLLRYGGMSVCTMLALFGLLALRPWLVHPWFVRCGRETLLIYVLQGLIFVSAGGLRLELRGTPWFGCVVAPLVAVLLCTVLVWFVTVFRRIPVFGPLMVGPGAAGAVAVRKE